MFATVSDLLASKEILNSQGCELLRWALTKKAVSELKKWGLSAQTLKSFLIEAKKKERGGSAKTYVSD